MRMALTILQVVCSVVIIGLVLLQRGKGAEAGAGFGAGASGTVFGARGACTALSRATAIFAAVFMLNSLALAYMGTRRTAEPKTIFDQPSLPAPTTATQPLLPSTPAQPAPAPAPTPAPEPAAPTSSGAPGK
jgi:preprotein translocase subunit SecG